MPGNVEIPYVKTTVLLIPWRVFTISTTLRLNTLFIGVCVIKLTLYFDKQIIEIPP